MIEPSAEGAPRTHRTGSLAGRVALVTAAGRNSGRATALRFAAEGADVVINARANRDELEAVAEEIRALGRRAFPILADVGDRAEVEAMVGQAMAEFGRVDILVNAAAIRPAKPFLELTAADWERVHRVVLGGSMWTTQAVLPSMVEHRFGRVLFFAGDGSWSGGGNRAHVSAAKMGLIGLCRGLATEFAPSNIRCNIVSPGRIDTSRDTSWYVTNMQDTSDIPLGRLGHVDDIANACLYLVSDQSDYVTGQTLHVNGGGTYF